MLMILNFITTVKISQLSDVVDMINHDLAAVDTYSKINCLKLNGLKNNYLVISSKPNINK